MKFLVYAVLAAASAQPVLACDFCAVYAATEAEGNGGKGFFGGIAEQFTHFGTLQNNGHGIPGQGQYIDSLVSQVFAGYNFNNRFGLQLNLPIIYRSFGSDSMRDTESGIGDASMIGNLRLYQKRTVDSTILWTALGGVKFPTGDSSRLGMPDSALPNGIGGHDLALGSGSYDGLVGTGVFARWERVFFGANTQYAIRTQGDIQHQYANDLTWSGGPGVYTALTDDYTLALMAVVSGETKGKDTFSGVPDGDSAETIVYLGPQINFTWSNQLSVQVGADLPVSIDNSGEQVLPSYRVHAALTWRF
jgi:hypothetical protein